MGMRKALALSLVLVCLLGLTVGAQEVATCSVQALFVSPDVDGVIEQELIALINQATSTLDIALYSFTDDQPGAAVIRAHQRGVAVRVILEERNVNSTGNEAEKLDRENISLRVDSASGLFHHKFAVIDNEIVITGSYNWSDSADDDNFEKGYGRFGVCPTSPLPRKPVNGVPVVLAWKSSIAPPEPNMRKCTALARCFPKE